MGTRGLTCVKVDGEYKVAQYGQFDHYPGGQGLIILNLLRSVDLQNFKEKVKSCSYLSEEEINSLKIVSETEWDKNYLHLDRNTGGKIFELINESSGLKLINRLDFASDSLFCEWAYVLDYDKGKFEVHKGFNKEQLSDNDAFKFLEGKCIDAKYQPVKLVASFPLENLPNVNEFLKFFDYEED